MMKSWNLGFSYNYVLTIVGLLSYKYISIIRSIYWYTKKKSYETDFGSDLQLAGNI